MDRRREHTGLRTILVGAIGLFTMASGAGAEEAKRFDFARPRMGTIVRVSVYCDDEGLANDAVSAAYARATELNGILSDYEPTSELNRLCRSARPGTPVMVSEPLFDVLERSQRLHQRSDGAFDVSIRPVVSLWRKSRRSGKLPPKEELAAALKRVGAESIVLDRRKRTVELHEEAMRLDLGGIAKGYVAEEMLKAVRSRGIRRAMVDAGGDLVLGDPPPGQDGWRVAIGGIEPPPGDDTSEKSPSVLVESANQSIATSGDLYKFVEIDGVRYSHIVDPATGLGLTTRATVTVVAPDGATADAYASAISVLGPDRGLALARKTKSVEARIQFVRDGSLHTLGTCGFPTPLPPRDNGHQHDDQ